MNKSVVVFVIACSVFVGSARAVSAQGVPTDRGYINVGWGVESGSSTMTDTVTATVYEESATVTTTAPFTSGSLFDVGVGIRVFRNFTVGAGYHQEQNDIDSTITGSIPSPIFFNRPRELNATESLNRKEMATHLMFGWWVPIGAKFDVLAYGGPSFFRLTQDAVSNVTPNEAGATNTTVNATVQVAERSKSVTGFNVGVDATYILWSNDSMRIGAGGFVRFTQASTDVQMMDAGSSQPTDVGGVQFGFGGRIRF
jgi:hypothetical protein